MRLQFTLSSERHKEFESFVQMSSLSTKKELFNNMFCLWRWAIEQRIKGRAIAAVDKNTGDYRELEMPAFWHAARAAYYRELEMPARSES